MNLYKSKRHNEARRVPGQMEAAAEPLSFPGGWGGENPNSKNSSRKTRTLGLGLGLGGTTNPSGSNLRVDPY